MTSEDREIRFDKNPILLLEDSKHEVVLFKITLRELEIENELIVATDGEEGLKVLRDAKILPGIIFLDINMPKMNGFEFLEIIKEDPQLKCLLVVILTSSNRKEDRCRAFSLGVSGYMTKPLDLGEYRHVIKTVLEYWRLSEGCYLPAQ